MDSSWKENDEDERKKEEACSDSLSDSSDSNSSDEDSDMEGGPSTRENKQSVQSTELSDEACNQPAMAEQRSATTSPLPPKPSTESYESESADGEASVANNTHSTLEQHQSSPKCSSSPGSQAEPYDFEKSLKIALQQECVEVDILKCVTLGPPAVGKTQLRRALTGNYEEVTESTPVSTGAEVIIEKYMDSEAKWQRFDLGEGQKALVTSVRERNFAEVSSDSPHMETRFQRCYHSRKQMSKDVKLVHSIAKVRALGKKFRESRDRMMKQLQQTDGAGAKSLHKARIIHLIDSGGQLSFFDVHSTLATSRAAYLQVFNLTESLDSKPKMTYRRLFPTKALDSRFRNIDFVARTLATLHDCKKKFMKMDEMISTVISGHKSNDLPVFLIGTHMDEAMSSEDSDSLTRNVHSMIEKECQAFPIWNEVVPNGNLNFHPVSCLVQSKAGIAELQKKISGCRGGYPIRLPLSWFFVELMFWAEKAAGDGCMKYSELRDICIQDNLLQSEDQFFTMVKLFHLLGLFSCPDLDREVEHDNMDDFPVFTDPNFLFHEISKILDIPFRDGLSGSLKDLQETGMLRQEALGDLGIPATAGTLVNFHDWLWDCLIMWGLAAAVKKRKGKGKAQKLEQDQELFIPSVLPPRPSTRDKDPDVCSLLVAFQDKDGGKCYHIPQGIFCHFIARLVQDKGYSVAPDVYRDLVSFKNVCRERVTYTVNVWEEMDHLAFSLVPESATKRTSIASYDAIRKELLQVLRAAWKHIYCGTPTLVVGFRCPCEGEGGSSRDHIAEYRNKFKDVSCRSKLRPGECRPASTNQMKWFGISKGKAVAGAEKENFFCTQPAPMNSSSSLPHGREPLHSRENIPIEASTEKNTRERSSQFSSLPLRMLEQGMPTPTHPSGISGENSSMGQVASDQPVHRVLEQHKVEFFEFVNAKLGLLTLIREGVINQDIQRDIEVANDKDAKEILYSHLFNHGSVETVIAYCNALIDANGYPHMETLGRRMKTALEQEEKETSQCYLTGLPRPAVSMNSSSSQSHTPQSRSPPLQQAEETGAGKQSSNKKGTKRRSSSVSSTSKPQSTLLEHWSTSPVAPNLPTLSLQRGDTQQVHGDSQIAGSQAAGHPLSLHPTHSSSSSSGIFSGGSEEMPSAPLSQPDDSPSDTPPPPKRSKTTHSSSSLGDVSGDSEVPLFQPNDSPSDTDTPPPPKRSKADTDVST